MAVYDTVPPHSWEPDSPEVYTKHLMKWPLTCALKRFLYSRKGKNDQSSSHETIDRCFFPPSPYTPSPVYSSKREKKNRIWREMRKSVRPRGNRSPGGCYVPPVALWGNPTTYILCTQEMPPNVNFGRRFLLVFNNVLYSVLGFISYVHSPNENPRQNFVTRISLTDSSDADVRFNYL